MTNYSVITSYSIHYTKLYDDIGEKIGADVPFCITGATAVAEGVGDILSPLPNLPECFIVIVKPDFDISTAEAFKKYDLFDVPKVSQFDDMIAAIATHDIETISSLLFNALEYAAENHEITKIKEEMLEMGALGALMTGSGSAVYGIFEKKRGARITSYNVCYTKLLRFLRIHISLLCI